MICAACVNSRKTGMAHCSCKTLNHPRTLLIWVRPTILCFRSRKWSWRRTEESNKCYSEALIFLFYQFCEQCDLTFEKSIVNKLERKHRGILVGLLIGHINLHYTLHKMKRANTRRCGAEQETAVHILRECPALEKKRIQTLDFARMDSDQIKEVRPSSIVPLGKGAGLLNSTL